MLKATGTFLVLVLSSYTCLCETENLSESCGCTIETVDSFNNQRIPSRVTELYCAQPGAPCVSDHYKVTQNLPYFLKLHFDLLVLSNGWIIGRWIHTEIRGPRNGCIEEKYNGWHWLHLQTFGFGDTKSSTNRINGFSQKLNLLIVLLLVT